jgi:hypothetical protein
LVDFDGWEIRLKYSTESLRGRNQLENLATNRKAVLNLTLKRACELVEWIELVIIGFSSEKYEIMTLKKLFLSFFRSSLCRKRAC